VANLMAQKHAGRVPDRLSAAQETWSAPQALSPRIARLKPALPALLRMTVERKFLANRSELRNPG
jgi:hypothetical protein